jgi:hypothetical protein
MPLHVTKGGLERAKLVNLSSKKDVQCMFNPHEYTLSKTNTFDPKTKIGKNTPKSTYKQGGSQTLKLTLYFDTLFDDQDVRMYTDDLWKMMMVSEQKTAKKTGISEPPEVAFEWGRLQFKAVITTMSQKFTLFKADGTPVRCTVDLTLEQKNDIDDYKDGVIPDWTKEVNQPQETPEEVTATEGDRLDNIIAQVAELGAEEIRKVAEKNGIDNPLNIVPGLKLNI